MTVEVFAGDRQFRCWKVGVHVLEVTVHVLEVTVQVLASDSSSVGM